MHETPKGVSASHDGREVAKRPFLSAPYVADGQGLLGPVDGIRQCPFAVGPEPCRLWRHGARLRKTGPRPAVQIFNCRTHATHFTVYPVGFTPYGRERIAPVGPDGEPARDAAGASVEPWRGTFLPGIDRRG